jgi:hypothetical protein
MGKLFTLDEGTKQVVQDALDDLITEFGKRCRVVYPPRWAACANCVSDPVGKKSANRWRTGGPLPFPSGSVCPLCNGAGGHHAEELSEEVLLLCAWEPKNFWYPAPGLDVRVPGGALQTKGFLSDMPKITRCDHLVFQLPVEPYAHYRYRLVGEPGDRSNIIQNRYFIANWQRAG